MAPGMICNESDTSSFISDSDAVSITSSPDVSSFLPLKPHVSARKNYVLHSKIGKQPRLLTKSIGNWWHWTDDRGTCRVLDGSGGAAVSSIGHGDQRVLDAKREAEAFVQYAPAADYITEPTRELAERLMVSTENLMGGCIFYGSGSDAMEAGAKMSIQYQTMAKINPEPSRRIFIARHRSYHGTTLASLELGGYDARKQPFRSNFSGNVNYVSPCYPYRELSENETVSQYVDRLAQELETEIQRLGPTNVAAFFMEPVVGAALGCVPALPGYMAAMKAVCRQHGVLLVLDEVMCGMGRTGYLHAWQEEMVVPDIQVIGKGLAGGYAEISGLLFSPEIDDAFKKTAFNHGHTFQNPPVGCATALAVLAIIEKEGLVMKVRENSMNLRRKLEVRLAHNPHVGNIRGTGYFWGIELVLNKATKVPFPSEKGVAMAIHEKGLTREHGVYIYPGAGTVDGKSGDHLIVAPAFNTSDDELDMIVERTGRLVDEYFDEYHRSTKAVL